MVSGQWLCGRLRCATRRVTARSKCLVVGSFVGSKAVHNKTEQAVKFYILFSRVCVFWACDSALITGCPGYGRGAPSQIPGWLRWVGPRRLATLLTK